MALRPLILEEERVPQQYTCIFIEKWMVSMVKNTNLKPNIIIQGSIEKELVL